MKPLFAGVSLALLALAACSSDPCGGGANCVTSPPDAGADAGFDAGGVGVSLHDINGEFPRTDVTMVIGANDVTNPAARNDPSLKAAIPMNPATTGSDFSAITVPTMILACEKDAIAPNKTFSAKYYASLSPNINHAYLEVAGADHLCPLSLAKASVQNTVSKTVISWLKRYVDEDKRYEPFITGASAPTYSKVDVQTGR